MHDNPDLRPFSSLSLFQRLFLVFIMGSVLLLGLNGWFYLKNAEESLDFNIRHEVENALKNVIRDCEKTYVQGLGGDLLMMETMPSLNNYLSGPPLEQKIIRQEIERQFTQVIKTRYPIYRSIKFVDAFGNERVHVIEGKRIRRLGSVLQGSEGSRRMVDEQTLFTRLKEMPARSILFSTPYRNERGQFFFTAGIVKREPEIGGFGGVLMITADLDYFVDYFRDIRLFERELGWLFTGNGLVMVKPDYASAEGLPESHSGEHDYSMFDNCSFGSDHATLLKVAFSFPSEAYIDLFQPVVERAYFAIGAVLLVSFLGSFWVSRQIATPVVQLARTSRSIRDGQLDARCPITTGAEIGELGRTFNEMAEKLSGLIRGRDQEIAERKEAERALAVTNRALQLNEARLNAMLFLSESAQRMSERDLMQYGLDQAVRLTGSELGYLRSLDEHGQAVRIYAGKRTSAGEEEAAREADFFRQQVDLWVDTLDCNRSSIENQSRNGSGFSASSGSNEHPLRYMSIPVSADKQLTMGLCVFNKPENYNQADQRHMQLIGNSLSKIVSLRRVLKDLEAAREDAELASRAKSVFLANMSHELRTPLNAILGFAHLMSGDMNIPDEQRAKLAIMNRSAKQLLSLINDVLEIARIDVGQLSLDLETVNLNGFFVSVAEVASVRARGKGLRVILQDHPELPLYVQVDVEKLHRILLNLVANAIKFTECGEIRIVPGFQVKGDTQVLSVDVIDMGRGIDDRDIPHVFDAFYQADTSLSAGEGSGMGLAISRKYAAMMGGELSVTSTPGEGSVFHLSIPVRTPASPSEPQLEFRDVCGLAPGQPRYRVLVTAKDQADRTLMTALLVRVGFDVRDARNGEEAVAMALHWRPDFIWLDLGASLEDGFAVAGRIKAMREGEGIKIAALTASAAAIGAEDAIAVGCDAFARKPIRPESVFRVMHEQLGVNYSYGKLQEANHHEKDNTTQQDVTRLPDKLTMSLLACAEQLDQTGMLQLIEQVEQHSAALAYSLRTLARSFRFDDIKELLADGQGHSA